MINMITVNESLPYSQHQRHYVTVVCKVTLVGPVN